MFIFGLMKFGFLFICFCLPLFMASAQNYYRVVSYNVENFFDIKDDSLTSDEDFTPHGKMRWTQSRYTDKVSKIGQALKAAGGEQLPVFIGLCEVENKEVLQDLAMNSVLCEGDYGVVHQDSPDDRGIDVAFLYRRADFRLLNQLFIPIFFPEDPLLKTRDILYASGILAEKDTLHFFVCHFPSMTEGEEQTEWRRERAAATLLRKIDSLRHINKKAGIIILGDLNGRADRRAQVKVLKVKSTERKSIKSNCLYNTGYYLLSQDSTGSYKYQGIWQTLDHIIVSGALLNKRHTFQSNRNLTVFEAPFLLEKDKKYKGNKPFRSYTGPRYHGGYSDHLPVYLDLK